MPRPKNKYRKGYIIFGMDQLCQRLRQGEWIYYREKVMHPGFVQKMELKTIMQAMDNRWISEAIDQQHEYYEKKYQEIGR